MTSGAKLLFQRLTAITMDTLTGTEREFRGFGRVEQIDVEDYGTFSAGNTNSPYITDDQTLYQPPVKTVTWYHTGAFLDRKRILSHFKDEYFPNWFENEKPGTQVLGDFRRMTCLNPTSMLKT